MRPHFLWVDAGALPFGSEHHQNSEHVFSFTLTHNEGEFATLKLVVKNPGMGLLHVSRKLWGWLSAEHDGVFYPLFYGRLIAAPVNVAGELIEVLLVGRPQDYVSQKQALAELLRAPPFFDPIFFDEARRDDPDNALEARSARWHYDPKTHEVSVSDILTGEDGVVEFEASDIIEETVTAEVTNPPISKVRLTCSFAWQQRAFGHIYLLGGGGLSPVVTLASFNNLESAWPKSGTGIGGGWSVGASQCKALYEPSTSQTSWSFSQEAPSPSDLSEERQQGSHKYTHYYAYSWHGHTSISESETRAHAPPGSITIDGEEKIEVNVEYDEEKMRHKSTQTSIQRSARVICKNYFHVVLGANYNPERRHTEHVTVEMSADLQELYTLPEEDETLDIAMTAQSVSEAVPPTPGTEDHIVNPAFPIGDTRLRSYICTDRGKQSLEYMLLVGRAALRSNARAIKVTFQTHDFDKWRALSLRKNATVYHPKLFGGMATGKVTHTELSLDGDSGELNMIGVIECAIGKGGAYEPLGGTPTYGAEEYMGSDYQRFEGGRYLIGPYGDVRYEAPAFNPQDDGANFIGGLHWTALKEEGDEEQANLAEDQRDKLSEIIEQLKNGGITEGSSGFLLAATTAMQNKVVDNNTKTVLTFKLPNLNKEFESPYAIDVDPLAIPKQYDLGAGV